MDFPKSNWPFILNPYSNLSKLSSNAMLNQPVTYFSERILRLSGDLRTLSGDIIVTSFPMTSDLRFLGDEVNTTFCWLKSKLTSSAFSLSSALRETEMKKVKLFL